MKIVVDLQGAQSESRHRGIGRHTAALVRAFAVEAARKHEVWIATNANLGHVEAVRAMFEGILPQERIVGFSVPGQVAAMNATNLPASDSGELLREDFLRNLDADVVWCSSLFEGWVDNSVTSIGRLRTDALQAVTLYDLIPLSDKGKHLSDPAVRRWYYRKLSHLQRADALLAISDYARDEAIELLNIAPERIHTISSAADSRFRPLDDEEKQAFRQALELDKPFVLYVGGYDSRKNVELLVQAFAGLSRSLRSSFELVLAGKITSTQETALRAFASKQGLDPKRVRFTHDTTDEDLVALYNLCSLFVFPSLQEGFGLPVLEAMACGAPVLAADATSLPEVVGRADMLFSPTDAAHLSDKIAAVLEQPHLAADLGGYGLRQARTFSWEASARRVLQALEVSIGASAHSDDAKSNGKKKPRLAFVSPLPPERTGIADYSAELLPSLERHYDIDVVVEQAEVDDPWIVANYPVRNAAWFCAHAHEFDRVLYQFGNSAFHLYQLDLMATYPGTVVMHDSFIGALSYWRAVHSGGEGEYLRRLYHAHGFRALQDDREKGRDWSVQNFPSNWEVLERAAGVIVHSQFAINQIRRFYGAEASSEVCRVAFPKRRRARARDASRRSLDIRHGDFVVCSFGMVAPTKLNHRLLSAWLASPLATDSHCHLVFVGENHGGDYGKELLDTIRKSGCADRIRITGFVDHATYHAWLEAADLAVQLRTESRGETSAAVFDCMAQGIPVIANAHATFAELDGEAVLTLPDEFVDNDLVQALGWLHGDTERREGFSRCAQNVIDTLHHPAAVAAQYHDAIEHFASSHFLAREQEVCREVIGIDGMNEEKLWGVASAMRANRTRRGPRKLFVDVTAVVRNDLKTGIERVTRNIATELLRAEIEGVRVELARFHEGRYHYARDYACQLLGLPSLGMPEEIIEVGSGDVFFGLDWVADVVPGNQALYQSWRDRGATVYFLVHDLLPVLKPEFFPPGIDKMHGAWLHSIASCADGLVCVSRTVARELVDWIDHRGVIRQRALPVGYSYSGAELDTERASTGVEAQSLSAPVTQALEQMRQAPALLMVGTVEPRKGHRTALQALDELWKTGKEVNLVIVGKLGWMMDAFGEELRAHPMYGQRLFWLTGIDDWELQALYEASGALLVASEGEGFGLPIIEAARHGVPVIARDLPVFREVAGERAVYFADGGASDLAEALVRWLELKRQGQVPASSDIPRVSWAQSARLVASMLTDPRHAHWIYHCEPRRTSTLVIGGAGLALDMCQATSELLRQGWAMPEPWGCWAVGPTAKLKVNVKSPGGQALKLSMVARAFVSPAHPRQTFELLANGESLGSWTHEYGQGLTQRGWVIPSHRFPAWASLELTVLQHDATSPKALGQSADARVLGLGVQEVAFTWIAPEEVG